MTASEQYEEKVWPKTWMSLRDHGFSSYESADDGYGLDQRPIRSVDRTVGGRRIKGVALKTRVGTHGYLEVKLYNDQGKQETRTVHSLVLLPRVGPCPPGHETRHLDNDPFNNRWRPGSEAETRAAGGNLIIGTKEQNAADRAAAGTQRTPAAYPCINHEQCGGMTVNEGRRCLQCAMEMGRKAAAMLNAGISLDAVTQQLGYQNAAWVYRLATRYGGYAESSAHARAQRQPWLRRVIITVRDKFRLTGRM